MIWQRDVAVSLHGEWCMHATVLHRMNISSYRIQGTASHWWFWSTYVHAVTHTMRGTEDLSCS